MPSDPSGLQPERDGRLECLECGRSFRLLPPHLGSIHGLSAAEYRQRHRLPRKLSLRASDLNETAREQGTARYSARPDIRANMAVGRQVNDRDRAVAASLETADFALVREARRRGGAGKRSAARRRIDERAQSCGFATIEDYLAAREGVAVAALARELGVARTTVSEWRRRVIGPASPPG
jgi:hypothetical protein